MNKYKILKAVFLSLAIIGLVFILLLIFFTPAIDPAPPGYHETVQSLFFSSLSIDFILWLCYFFFLKKGKVKNSRSPADDY